MTERQIEIAVEKKTDRLDRQYMSGEITTDEYHEGIKAIDAWAEQQTERKDNA